MKSYFSQAAQLTDGVYIVDVSLLIIAQVFLLRAIESFKRSRASVPQFNVRMRNSDEAEGDSFASAN